MQQSASSPSNLSVSDVLAHLLWAVPRGTARADETRPDDGAPRRGSLAFRERRSVGQILVISAFGMVVFIGLVGTSVDYGLLLLEKTRLQNALDAASLAGARALVSGASAGVTSAEAVARNYLQLHGYQAGVRNTNISFTFPPSAGGGLNTVSIAMSRRVGTFFWRTLGIGEVTVAGSATAQTGGGTYDVILSIDETSALSCCDPGDDMPQLRAAATAFVDQMQLSTTDTRSSRIGIVQFQGQQRRNGGACRSGDATSGNGGNVCLRDAHALLDLTADRTRVLQVINGPGSGCPALPSQPSSGFLSTQGARAYGCPLEPIGGTGRYIRNGFEITFMSGTWNLWSTARGGRADARKALVIFVAGENEVTTPSTSTANTRTVNAANAVKPGADGVSNSPAPLPDDVQIFVVGLFSDQSVVANTIPPGCPSDTLPPYRNSFDNMLIAASSSRTGGCDHYYPMVNNNALPQAFRAIAAAISRSQLAP